MNAAIHRWRPEGACAGFPGTLKQSSHHLHSIIPAQDYAVPQQTHCVAAYAQHTQRAAPPHATMATMFGGGGYGGDQFAGGGFMPRCATVAVTSWRQQPPQLLLPLHSAQAAAPAPLPAVDAAPTTDNRRVAHAIAAKQLIPPTLVLLVVSGCAASGAVDVPAHAAALCSCL